MTAKRSAAIEAAEYLEAVANTQSFKSYLHPLAARLRAEDRHLARIENLILEWNANTGPESWTALEELAERIERRRARK